VIYNRYLRKPSLVLLLLCALAIVTFLDRIAISVAGPRIQQELAIPPERWGWILGAFVLAYGIFEVPTGALGDRSGHARVLTRIVLWWSGFTCFTGMATGFTVLLATRFLFGMGEAGAYPNIAGVLSRWFAPEQRARTQGLIWAASRFGGALSPLLVVPLQARIGWRWSFAALGGLGLLWTLAWSALYRDRAAGAASRVAHVTVPWRELLGRRQLWIIFAMYFSQAWGSWFYFGWFPSYLVKGMGFSEAEMGIFSALPFFMGSAGSLAGGFAGDRAVARLGLRNGRRLMGSAALGISALLLVALSLSHRKVAIVVLSSLGFGIADLMLPTAWAVCLDIGGAYAGVVSGTMNTAGQLGGFICSVLFGYAVAATGGYTLPLWIVAAMVMAGALLFTRIDASKPLVATAAAG
jgi:predicted MFS family arabinose efflux permease